MGGSPHGRLNTGEQGLRSECHHGDPFGLLRRGGLPRRDVVGKSGDESRGGRRQPTGDSRDRGEQALRDPFSAHRQSRRWARGGLRRADSLQRRRAAGSALRRSSTGRLGSALGDGLRPCGSRGRRRSGAGHLHRPQVLSVGDTRRTHQRDRGPVTSSGGHRHGPLDRGARLRRDSKSHQGLGRHDAGRG